MTEKSLLIVDDDAVLLKDLRELLRNMGYFVVGEAKDPQSALILAHKLRPDLVIMEVGLQSGTDGVSAASMLIAERIAVVAMLTGLNESNLAQRAATAGVTGYVLKPFNEDDLRPAIEIALACIRQIQSLQQEVRDVREELETLKIIEQAKCLLMHELKLTEDEAQRRIERASTNSSKTPRAVAEAIILARQVGA